MSSLEEMMKHYQPDPELLEEMIKRSGEMEMSGEEKERILQMTLQKAGFVQETENQGEERKNMKAEQEKRSTVRGKGRRRKVVLLAACVAAFAMVTIGYAAGVDLDRTFMAWFGPSTEEQIEALKGAGTVIGEEQEIGGTTVRVREAIGDESSVNVLIDVIAPEGTALDADQYTFYRPFVDVEGATGLGYHFEELEDKDAPDNVYSTVLVLSSAEPLNGKRVSLQLKDLCIYKQEDERKAREQGVAVNPKDYIDDAYRVILPGEWKLEFNLNYEETSVKTYPNVKVESGGETAVVKELRVSPISMSVDLRRSLLAITGGKDEMEQAVVFDSAIEDVQIRMKDGTVLEPNSGGTFSEGRTVKLDVQYGKIINVEDIDSITLYGKELWKK